MKRYTLKFTVLDPTINTDQLGQAVDEMLLRLHPRITYKLGQVILGEDGGLMVKIAMEGKRKLLESALKGWKWKLPVRLESLGWGWRVNEDATLLATATSMTDTDPLAGVEPFEGIGEFPVSKWHLRRRYITLMIFTLGLILILAANAIYTHSPLLEWIYIVWFGIFIFSLNDTPLDFRVYAEKIGIRQQKLEVIYWMLKEPVSLEWDRIWGLDYVDPVCKVYSEGGKTRFLISERFGCKEKNLVLKTIMERAGLAYVEGNIRTVVYRRYDAQDSGG